MATEFAMDARPFFQILHSMLRHNELDYDSEQIGDVVEWVRKNSTLMRRVSDPNEWRLVATFYDYWKRHKIAVTRSGLEDLVRQEQKNEAVLQILKEYDRHAEDLEPKTHLDLDLYLDQRISDWEKWRLSTALDSARSITVGSRQMRDEKTKKDVILTGPRDALKFLHQRISEGVLLDHVKRVGGDTITEGAPAVRNVLERAARGQQKGFLTQTPLDEALDIGPQTGIKFVGILGFSNQRKSTLLFTLAYLAATQGYRVLLVPRECSVEEAWVRIYWLHVDYVKHAEPLSPLAERLRELPALAKVRDKKHVRREHAEIIDELAEDMGQRGIRIHVESLSSFAEVKQCAEAHVNDPYDVLCVDYMGHLETPGEKDRIEGIKKVFRAAQMLSQDYDNRRGLVVMTPVQANKTAERAVAASEDPLGKGIYAADIGQIEYLTDAGRDMDAIIGIWSGDGFREHGLARISCVKTRQQHFEPFFMSIDERSQRMRHVNDEDAMNRITAGVMAKHPVQPKQTERRVRMSDVFESWKELD